MKAYNQAMIETLEKVISTADQYHQDANLRCNLREANKGLGELVEKIYAVIKEGEQVHRKNLWNVSKHLPVLGTARSWEVFNARFVELLHDWRNEKARCVSVLDSIEQAERSTGFKVGDPVELSDGRRGTVQAVQEDGLIKVRNNCDTYSLTIRPEFIKTGRPAMQAASVEPEPLVDVVVYFLGRERGDTGVDVGMKHVTRAADMEAAIKEARDLFHVLEVKSVYVNGIEVNQHFVTYCATMQKIESRLKSDGVDFMDEEAAIACLSECVLPTKLIALYREELASRRHEAAKSVTPVNFGERITTLNKALKEGGRRWLNEWVLVHAGATQSYSATFDKGYLELMITCPTKAAGMGLFAGKEAAEAAGKRLGHGVVTVRRFRAIEALKTDLERRALESFGLNPQTVTETLQRVGTAMRRDGLTREQITLEVMAAYMDADHKTQQKMFTAYMTDERTRKSVQHAVLDLLKRQETNKNSL